MNITGYGIANYCGYGCLYTNGYSRSFGTNVEIRAESKSTTRSVRQLNWNPSELRGLGINGIDGRIYVVFDSDSGNWKEYFSGMTIKQANKAFGYGYGRYDVDSSNIKDYCLVLSMDQLYECSAVEFADAVSKYTKKQIKEIVAELHKRSEDAIKWKNELEKLIKEVKDERTRKESGLSGVESKLASGFGKYGINSSDNRQDESKAKKEQTSEQRETPKQPATQEDKLRWIRQGRCAFCGGEFKGLITKVCRDCGKTKNYR